MWKQRKRWVNGLQLSLTGKRVQDFDWMNASPWVSNIFICICMLLIVLRKWFPRSLSARKVFLPSLHFFCRSDPSLRMPASCRPNSLDKEPLTITAIKLFHQWVVYFWICSCKTSLASRPVPSLPFASIASPAAFYLYPRRRRKRKTYMLNQHFDPFFPQIKNNDLVTHKRSSNLLMVFCSSHCPHPTPLHSIRLHSIPLHPSTSVWNARNRKRMKRRLFWDRNKTRRLCTSAREIFWFSYKIQKEFFLLVIELVIAAGKGIGQASGRLAGYSRAAERREQGGGGGEEAGWLSGKSGWPWEEWRKVCCGIWLILSKNCWTRWCAGCHCGRWWSRRTTGKIHGTVRTTTSKADLLPFRTEFHHEHFCLVTHSTPKEVDLFFRQKIRQIHLIPSHAIPIHNPLKSWTPKRGKGRLELAQK